jgi:hypothetical protein
VIDLREQNVSNLAGFRRAQFGQKSRRNAEKQCIALFLLE